MGLLIAASVRCGLLRHVNYVFAVIMVLLIAPRVRSPRLVIKCFGYICWVYMFDAVGRSAAYRSAAYRSAAMQTLDAFLKSGT